MSEVVIAAFMLSIMNMSLETKIKKIKLDNWHKIKS